MLLCVDVGNTNIVFGVYQNDLKICDFRLETNVNQTSDEYGSKVIDIIKKQGVDTVNISNCIIASVVPIIDATLEALCIKYFGIKPIFIGPGIKTGLKIKADNPKELGADILVGCVSAYNKYGGPLIVIDMGTATTLFVVTKEKEIVGGIIIPGLKISFANLFDKTSKLEKVRIDVPKNIIGKDTMSCIQSGMIYGTSCQIDGLINKIKTIYSDAKVILTGGIGGKIKPFLDNQVYYEPDLILDGLNILFKKNCNK